MFRLVADCTYLTFGGLVERFDPPIGVFRTARGYVQSGFLVVFSFQAEAVQSPRVRCPHHGESFEIKRSQRMSVLKVWQSF